MRILYGVVGEGVGHATRSRVLLEALREQLFRAADGKGRWGEAFARGGPTRA
jgi:hypothetical protein